MEPMSVRRAAWKTNQSPVAGKALQRIAELDGGKTGEQKP